ncbi:MAG: segregation/condensation protein A [Syntrophomonadaceae bacterium]|nr:segregation/condensation protein A [Syntrophomonadaceae bacterium]
MKYLVALEAFHGPLDLLLYLIDKNQVDIYDIPIAEISDQFIAYLEQGSSRDLENISEFLVMASYLLQLKSVMLLPDISGGNNNPEGGPEDPRAELVEKLLAYKEIRETADFLSVRWRGNKGKVYYSQEVREPAEKPERAADAKALFKAYRQLSEYFENKEKALALPERDISVEEKMAYIMGYLAHKSTDTVIQDLLEPVSSRREALVLFLALLELIRQQKVYAIQSENFGAIRIYVREEGYAGQRHD